MPTVVSGLDCKMWPVEIKDRLGNQEMIINWGDGVAQKKSGHIPQTDIRKVGVLLRS